MKRCTILLIWGFPGGSDSKESACKAGDPVSIPGLWRSPGEGNGNPFQFFCLEKEEPGRLQFMQLHRLGHDCSCTYTYIANFRKIQNYNEVSLSDQNGHYLKSLLIIDTARETVERKELIIWSCYPTPGHISKGNSNLKRYRHSNIYSSTVYNSQDMERFPWWLSG